MSSTKRVAFVDFAGFLEAALELGIDLDDGLKELMDNSVDSGAEKINVVVESIVHPTEKDADGKPLKGMRLSVIDDGRGIPLTITDDNGLEWQGLPYMMSFGGRQQQSVIIKGQRRNIGRFGWGLSATISCLSRERGRTIVWTKQVEDSAWRSCTWRYEDVLNDDCQLPAEDVGPMPAYLPLGENSGTVVMIDTYEGDRKRLGPLQDMLLKHAARTYRHRMVEDGLQIRISTIPEGGWDNGSHKWVNIRDPLCRLEGSDEVKLFGPAKTYPQLVFTFDGDEDNPVGEFGRIDDDDGEPVQVKVEITLMDRSRVNLALFSDPSIKLDKLGRDRVRALWGVGMRGQGFAYIRDGREIVHSRSQGIYQRHGNYNYMHGEIHFPHQLDLLFGIQSNKSRFDVHARLRKVLEDEIADILKMVLIDAGEQSDDNLATLSLVENTEAEKMISGLAPRLPTPIYTPEQVQEGQAQRAKERLEAHSKLHINHAERMAAVLQKQQERSEDGTWKAARELELEQQLEAQLLENEQRWSHRAPVRFSYRPAEESEGVSIYDVESYGDEVHVSFQKGSPLIDMLQSPDLKDDEHLQKALQLMIGALAYAEHMDCIIDGSRQAFWIDARNDISRRVNDFLEAFRPIIEGEGVEE